MTKMEKNHKESMNRCPHLGVKTHLHPLLLYVYKVKSSVSAFPSYAPLACKPQTRNLIISHDFMCQLLFLW